MANTYTQIHIQAVFAVKFRECVIRKIWKDELCKYITGIVQDYSHKVLAVNTMPDHMHLFFGMRPTQSLSDLMEEVKGHSSKWINKKGFTPKDFAWQEGYGGFSYGKSQVNDVIKYVHEQELHHKHKSFIQEYKEHLTLFGIEHDDRYLFKPIEYDPE